MQIRMAKYIYKIEQSSVFLVFMNLRNILLFSVLTKYVAKGEPRSPFFKKALTSIVSSLNENVDSHKLIKKVVMKTIGERDHAA